MSLNDYEFTVVHSQLMVSYERDGYLRCMLEARRRAERRLKLKRFARTTARFIRGAGLRIAGFGVSLERKLKIQEPDSKMKAGVR